MEITVNLKENLSEKDLENDLKKQIALELYKSGKCSTGFCAHFCGLNYDDFLLFISENKVSIFSQSLSEILEDAKRA